MSTVVITKERKVITYSDFWRTSDFLLTRGTENDEGSYFMFLSSLIFSAFSLEAFLNHIGEHVFDTWNDLERLSARSKLNVISEQLVITVDYGATPWQVIPEIIGFRNKVAHGKNALLKFEETVHNDDRYEEIMHEFLFTDWQNYATQENAESVRTNLEQLFTIVHEAANIEEDFLFNHGSQTGMAHTVQE